MKDFLGNDVHEGDTVVIAIRSGKYATLGRAYVIDEGLRPQFSGGTPVPVVQVEWSNIHKYWFLAKHVVKINDDMLPDVRRGKLNDVEEGVQVSEL